MGKMDVVNALGPAWRNMSRVLFRPFSLVKWLSLGFITLVAYGGGGYNANLPGNWSDGRQPNWPHSPWPWVLEYWPLLVLGFLILVAIGLILSWIGSLLHFVYVDDIIRNSAAIKEPFARLRGRGTSYFLWRLIFGLAYFLVFLILVATPLIWAFAIARGAEDVWKILAVVWAVLAAIPLIFIGTLIDIFVRDFATTAMYVQGVGIIEGLHIAWRLIKANAGQTALYVLMLILIGMGAAVYGLFVGLAVALGVGIPVGLLVAAAIFLGHGAGLEWTVSTIAIAVSVGVVLLFGLIYLVQCAIQPAQVFRRSYALTVVGQADPSLETIPTGK